MLPHHDGSALYVSDQAPRPGDTVRVRVRVPEAWGAVASVHVRSTPDREPRFRLAQLLGTADGWQWWEAEVEILNPVNGYRFLISRADGGHWWLNAAGAHDFETLDAEDFKLLSYPAPPDWAAATVMYQIFPDRFGRSPAAALREKPAWGIPAAWGDPVETVQPARSHQFYGGDLDGIGLHLDHLERLGVTMLYLTPVFPAGSSHRYDAQSFDEVDPALGGDAALVRLVEAAHERGFKVIGDLTANHSGDRHEWFRAARHNPAAAESAFYYWLDEQHEHYESWLDVPSLPKFNWTSPELRRRFIEGPDSVVAKWLRAPYHLDGWRIDVANMTGRLQGEDLNAEVRQTIRRTMIAENPDTILLGESTNDASGDFQGDGWHGAMTYTTFTRPVWSWLSKSESPSSFFGLPYGTIPQCDGRAFVDAHLRFTAGYPWRTRLATMNALDTHDTPRFRTHAINGGVGVGFGLSATLPGIPVVFAGDEFGLVGDDGEGSRTPMPWDTAGDPEVAATIDLYAALIHLRTAHPALNGGGMRWVHVGADVLVYVRECADESVLLVAARTAGTVTLPAGAVAGMPALLLGDAALSVAGGRIRLETDGPSFTAWSLPGIVVPDRAPRSSGRPTW
ncbi:glycoside hydrolase family 13 protein [Cryobacterium cheniae]|uniref:Glycoside hydrolase family 13 protein n=1 Tax=Cryobacterium cheniae TaxID=1259262 RepID=A0A4V3IHM7_9MICO|nr:glycoside hydrolase family 13 protein [Cryobacterium cheniae]TFC77421.1 glycoside hydrolase family 13 protein [Cryobacterium cheniae]